VQCLICDKIIVHTDKRSYSETLTTAQQKCSETLTTSKPKSILSSKAAKRSSTFVSVLSGYQVDIKPFSSTDFFLLLIS